MVTNPKPRERCVILSVMRAASVTVPYWLKRSCRSFSVVSKERFPTYSFICLVFGNNCEPQSRSREPGFKSPLTEPTDDLPRNEQEQSIQAATLWRHSKDSQG